MSEPHRPILEQAVAERASDLLVKAGSPPVVRVQGLLKPLSDNVLTPEETGRIVKSLLTQSEYNRLLVEKEITLSRELEGRTRMRVHVHFARGQHAVSFRLIPLKPPTLEELGVPAPVRDLLLKPGGLILVTGPSGAGKSTTLAAMIDHINRNRTCNVVTIEDPIEHVHSDDRAFLRQQEVGEDTRGIPEAVAGALRLDPDVVAISELQDLETIRACLNAAVSGPLVLATIRYAQVAETVNRIIDLHPPEEQDRARARLGSSLSAILSQKLVARADGKGRIPAWELMIATPAAHNLIREGKTHSLVALIQTGAKLGMTTMTNSLLDLQGKGLISLEEAIVNAPDPHEIRSRAGR